MKEDFNKDITKEQSSSDFLKKIYSELNKMDSKIEKENPAAEENNNLDKPDFYKPIYISNENFIKNTPKISKVSSEDIPENENFSEDIWIKAKKMAKEKDELVNDNFIDAETTRLNSRIEALKGNIEGNEFILHRLIDELAGIKKRMEFFNDMQQIIELTNTAKNDLTEMKNLEPRMKMFSDKVDIIYSELKEKLDSLDLVIQEIDRIKNENKINSREIFLLKNKISHMATKEDLERIELKVQRYADALKSIDKKSSLTRDISDLREMLKDIR